jgi:rhodanese-related sulfurtransferase
MFVAFASVWLAGLTGPVHADPPTLTPATAARAVVTPIAPEHLSALRERSTPLIVIDVRDPPEFAVGRISGAVRLDAHRDAADVRRYLRGKPRGAVVLLYCTSGARSEVAARLLAPTLAGAGARAVHTLAGGIIAWANAGQRLVDDGGATMYVHTYNESLAQLLIEPARARFLPR